MPKSAPGVWARCTARFEREARAIAALNHPNVCQIYDIGPNYLVMEYVDGLPVFLSGQDPVSQGKTAQLAQQIASAIEAAFKRAIELDPGNGNAHGYYSWFLAAMGRKDEAVKQAQIVVKMDPLDTSGNGNFGSVLVFNHQWDEAIEVLRNAIDLDPNYWFDYNFLGRAYEAKGQLAEAIETFKRGLTLEGNTELYAGLGHAYALSGDKVAAYKVLDQLGPLSKQRYVAPYNVAVIYAGLGEKDRAFDWLSRAYQDRSYLLPVYLNTDSRLDSLRSDPRFHELRRKMALPDIP